MLATPSTSSCANRSTLLERPLVVRTCGRGGCDDDGQQLDKHGVRSRCGADREPARRATADPRRPPLSIRRTLRGVLPPTAALAVHAGSDRAARSAHSDGTDGGDNDLIAARIWRARGTITPPVSRSCRDPFLAEPPGLDRPPRIDPPLAELAERTSTLSGRLRAVPFVVMSCS
jgi:hypothetical protein